MTRTARAGFPKAMMRDRSESRSGLDKSMRKNGGGGHNWGSLADERDHEFAALDDDAVALQVTAEEVDDDAASVKSDTTTESKSSVEHDVENAKKFRKHVFKGDVDLAAIARTSSAVSGSPPNY